MADTVSAAHIACWFQASSLDRHGFVVDFSSLRPLERRLAEQFDHTFLVNADDPLLEQWRGLHEQGALDLRVMENVGMEASAELVWHWANELIREQEGGRACCWRVEARENDRNAAWFTAVPRWFPAGGQQLEPPAEVSYAEPLPAYGSGDAGLEPPAPGEPWEAP